MHLWEPKTQKCKDKETGRLTDLRFVCWDFAGQQEYYVTHQLFLTSRAVYLLVFDCKGFEKALMENTDKKSQEKAMRKEFTDSVQTWLDQVQARIPGATVMLAASKIDMLKKPETTVPKITETVLRFIKDSEHQ